MSESIQDKSLQKLTRDFYRQDALSVAPKLLGKLLVKNYNSRILSGMIVEVEAYRGTDDAASHTFNGKTKRNEVMYYEGGYLYVYFTYGMYHCCNVVTGKAGEGEAVLIRALQPVEGAEEMIKNRHLVKSADERMKNISNGPGKLCIALGIDRKHNGISLLGDKIYMTEYRNIKSENIITTERIGISKSKHLLWRFYIKDNEFLSR
ncbi:MAG: DNA-3-methyladenine glycosylase [Melioribacteraceae bacterium]|nr:DNA-3-methyladenine glycosylase [Melioribacteraceae bacterium]